MTAALMRAGIKGALLIGILATTVVGVALHLALQLPLSTVPGKLELVPGGLQAETRQTMANIEAVLKANGLTFDDVFKCTVMLADMGEWAAFNRVYLTYFKPERLPARSAFGASSLALNARVELECWAYVGKK